jgi:hypothetical protein
LMTTFRRLQAEFLRAASEMRQVAHHLRMKTKRAESFS